MHLLAIPYDSALRGVRMGAGPERLLSAGLAEDLEAARHRVRVACLEPASDAPPAEIRTAFELNRALARRVRSVAEQGAMPVILAGNCITAVGTLAGMNEGACGVLWFDSHRGFLDGMALAIVSGRCWREIAATVPAFRLVPEREVILLGTRDLDPLERELLDGSEITLLRPTQVRTELTNALDALRTHTRDVYVHLDLYVLDPEEGRANAFAAPDGLRVEELLAALQKIRRGFRVRAVALTACDPAFDPEGRVSRAASSFLRTLLATEGPSPG